VHATRLLPIALFAALAAGCGTAPPIPVNYAPSSVMTAAGSLNVGEFNYLPAAAAPAPAALTAADSKNSKDSARKVKAVAGNQIRNTAMGNIFIDREVRTFVRDAVFSELRFVGIKTDGTKVRLTGDIEEFLIDDLGYSVDWTLRIRYELRDIATQKVVYESVKNTQRNTNKFANVFGALNETIKINAEELMKDQAFLSAIAL